MLTTPLVAGLAFRERLDQLPTEFKASLQAEPANQYNPCAIAVMGPSGKVGYVAPELARPLYERVLTGEATTCLVRRGDYSATTGIVAVLEL